MFNNVQQGGARRQGRRWTECKFERSSNLFFNTSTEASVAVDMVEGAECKRERGHRSFAGDETFPFLESESMYRNKFT